MSQQIPGPRALPLIGNLLDLQDEVPLNALERLADIYGPIFKITIRGQERTFVTNYELFDELCDETRFFKRAPQALQNNDSSAAEGLFSAFSEKSEDWGQAHRILMPAFGPLAIEAMFDEMYDIATQLVLKWARQGPEHKIPVTGDFSRLTLDTIALCAMDFRFNSFYQDGLHPYVEAMNNILGSRSNASQISSLLLSLLPSTNEKLKHDAQYLQQVAQEVVQHRRDNRTDKNDLLNSMIYGKDPKTGQTMREALIAANMQTFLIAGHETTSGLLSFAFLRMLKNPETLFAAQREVDTVIGKNRITVKHLRELKYINAVLRETLRLTPTAPAFLRAVRPENKEPSPTIGHGKYAVPQGHGILCLLGKIQRDPKVFGDDANEFKPERMLDENFEKLPKNAWKPFGTGLRACIGRAFAWQEALLVVAVILQNFNVCLDDPQYEMRLVQTLTIKPKDLYIRVSLRDDLKATELQQRLLATSTPLATKDAMVEQKLDLNDEKARITILYGSNTGTCQTLAQKLSAQASQNGFKATVTDMDSFTGRITKDVPTIIITASYEGQPPDNAARFVAWLESLHDQNTLEGAKFAVFGCGHSDWNSTYMRIPKLVDEKLNQLGATRLTERGASDAAKRDMFGDFDTWTETTLWPGLKKISTNGNTDTREEVVLPTVKFELSTQKRAQQLQQNCRWAKVIDTEVLTAPNTPEKRHISIELPPEMIYETGDYLAVLPLNPEASVKRVIKRFDLPWDATITITDAAATVLPKNLPLSVSDLLKGYVEILQLATRKDIEILRQHTKDSSDAAKLEEYAKSDKYSEILHSNTSVLDLLEQYSNINLPFEKFLGLLQPLRLRHYSISSSPLPNARICTLTYSVIDEPSTVDHQKRFQGVTGTYLRSLGPGDQILVSIRSTNKFFHLPIDMDKTPIMMFCAGSGIAPFRGFIQERAVLIQEGNRKLAPALLFVGCRSPKTDRLYGDQFDEWVRIGAVDIRYAFSRDPDASQGCKYIQDRLIKDKEEVYNTWDSGAKVFICGSGQLAKEFGQAARTVIKERMAAHGKDISDEKLNDWIANMRNDRFVADVFS